MNRKKIHLDSRHSLFIQKLKSQAIQLTSGGILIPLVLFFYILTFFPGEAKSAFWGTDTQAENFEKSLNSQNMPLLQVSVSAGLDSMRSGSDITVEKDALLPETGPSGSIADIEGSGSDQISTYVVRAGDTLGEIADMFNVSINTIVWANDIRGGKITPGQTLAILPVSGVKYVVQKADTLQSLAKKFNADETEVIQFNDLPQDGKLTVGAEIIIPDGEIDAPSAAVPSSSGKYVYYSGSYGTSRLVKGYSGPNYAGYYARPIAGGHKTQGLHGYNAVDLGTPLGTSVHAAASGVVIISKSYGWNGGYGQYIAIKHPNGTETLYAHLSKNVVAVGLKVNQGDLIGLSGSTGKSTGPHLHFEVRGAVNPF